MVQQCILILTILSFLFTGQDDARDVVAKVNIAGQRAPFLGNKLIPVFMADRIEKEEVLVKYCKANNVVLFKCSGSGIVTVLS